MEVLEVAMHVRADWPFSRGSPGCSLVMHGDTRVCFESFVLLFIAVARTQSIKTILFC